MLRKQKDNFRSLEELKLFLRIYILITIVPFLFKFNSMSAVLKLVTPKKLRRYKYLDPEQFKAKLVKYTDFLLRQKFWINSSSFLKRSVVLYYFLREYGINVQICIGVRLSKDEEFKNILEGHAWLLYNEQVLLEKNEGITKSYNVTYSYPEVSSIS